MTHYLEAISDEHIFSSPVTNIIKPTVPCLICDTGRLEKQFRSFHT